MRAGARQLGGGCRKLALGARAPRGPAWAPYCAAGALGVAGLSLLDGHVHAKTPEVRQEVYVWGRRETIPGGALRDLVRPQRCRWFEAHPRRWAQLAFGPDFGVARDESGDLFIWGASGEDDFVGPVPLAIVGEAKGQKFVDVQCSAKKVFALTAAGGAFVFEGLGEAFERRTANRAAADAPLELKSYAVQGLPRPGWTRIFGAKSGVKAMAIGLEHAAFATHSGEVWCVGGNEWGQSGVAPPKRKGPMSAMDDFERVEVPAPVRVPFPEEAGPIVNVIAGGRHTLAVDKAGQVFAFGDDRRIQLGLGDTRSGGADNRNAVGVLSTEHMGGKKTRSEMVRAVTYKYYQPHMQWYPVRTVDPKAVNRPRYPAPSLLACGEDFTVAVHRDSPNWYAKEDETNVVFATGENSEGQCGRNWQSQQQSWNPARLPKHSRVVDIACGQGHTLARLATGELFFWGMNSQGQGGTGSRAAVCPPVRLVPGWEGGEELPDPSAKPVAFIACGFRTSAAVCEVPTSPVRPVAAPAAEPSAAHAPPAKKN